jgi:hypothetical protein
MLPPEAPAGAMKMYQNEVLRVNVAAPSKSGKNIDFEGISLHNGENPGRS